MGKHTLLGFSKVAKLWRNVYQNCQVGGPFSEVVKIAGRPDETLRIGESILYTYVSNEWKGVLRGGCIARKMQFVVKDGIVVSKKGMNLDLEAW